MPKQNLTQYAALGLLNLAPRTGYDIKAFVESTMSHFWNESYRWIYTTLEQLEADGLASARAEDRGERQRLVYRITKKGERFLQGWLGEPAAPRKVRDELMLKVLFSQMVPARTGLRQIEHHHARMLEHHNRLQEIEGDLDASEIEPLKRESVAMTLDLSRRVTAAHLRWCEDQLKKKSRTGKKRTRSS